VDSRSGVDDLIGGVVRRQMLAVDALDEQQGRGRVAGVVQARRAEAGPLEEFLPVLVVPIRVDRLAVSTGEGDQPRTIAASSA